MPQSRATIRVTGRVQGVWYRQSTKQTAEQYGVVGWVRNNLDGSVSAVFEGEQHAVQSLVDWCRQGPPAAKVTELELEWQTPSGEFTGFRVR